MIWKAPLREDDREQQVQVVEGFISQGVSGLVLAPLDSARCVRPVEEAEARRHPHRDLRLGAGQSDEGRQLRLDRQRQGRPAGRQRAWASCCGGKGTVLMLRYQEGSAATEEREQGFLDELKASFPGIKVDLVGSVRRRDPRHRQARVGEPAESLRRSSVDGIFTPNESSTAGMLLALQDIGKAGTIAFVGFDSSPAFIDPLRNGRADRASSCRTR